MNEIRFRNLRLAIVMAISIAAFAGCARTDPASYIASANAYIAKSDYKAAIIELKNALQKAPDNAEARLLLAKSLLLTGDVAGAETEVRKAIDAHADDDRVYPLLAEVLVAEGKFAEVTKDLGTRKLRTPEARADLGVAVAAAYLAQRDAKSAASAVDAVLAEKPTDVHALLLKAQLVAMQGDAQSTRRYIESALAQSPDDAEVLLMKAQLELTSGKSDDARKLMEQAIKAHPQLSAPRFALASLALRTGKLDVASPA